MPRRPSTTTASKPPAAPKGVPVAKWIARPLVVCVDGPLASRWYFADDWQASVAAARHLVERGAQDTSVFLQYVATDATREHPTQPTRGQVLRWRGTNRREQ